MVSVLLQRRFIKPTIHAWKEAEPTEPEPFRWSGILDDLIHTIELDPACDDTRRRLILKIVGNVGFSTHELPRGISATSRVTMIYSDLLGSRQNYCAMLHCEIYI